MLKKPFSSAMVEILVPLIFTVAFGTGVPFVFFMLPVMLWAKTKLVVNRNDKRISILFFMILLFIFLSVYWFYLGWFLL
ncbi:hypothetical protein D3C86_2156870 [compost metagenome]